MIRTQRDRVRPADRKNLKLYERFVKTSQRAIRRIDSAQCPWHLIAANDRCYRELSAGRIILESVSFSQKGKTRILTLLAAQLPAVRAALRRYQQAQAQLESRAVAGLRRLAQQRTP